MPDRSLFNYPFHEQPTDDPVMALLRDVTIHYKLIAASIHRLSTHWLCQRSSIAGSLPAFVPLAGLLSAAHGALSQCLLSRGRVIPISIN